MNETKNELNDIILNKGNGEFGGFKKILLAVATFAVLLIIVIVIMSTLGDTKGGLADTLAGEKTEEKVLPPAPESIAPTKNELFKPALISEENGSAPAALDLEPALEDTATQESETPQAQPLESTKESKPQTVIEDPYDALEADPIAIKPVTAKTLQPKAPKTPDAAKEAITNRYYVQVGSFVKAKPNKTVLGKIKQYGYDYAMKRVEVRGTMVTKLLIGPYPSYREAKLAKEQIAKKIEPNAFIYKAQ